MSALDRHPVSVPRTLLPPLLIGLAFYAASTAFALLQHTTLHTRARDMGIYVQALWSGAQGRPFLTTLLQENTNHLAEHVAPLLWPLVPLAGLWSDAVPLIVLQQTALALCGWPIYSLARAKLGRGLSVLLLAGFYLMPAMSRVSLSEFHPVVVAALPMTAAVVAGLRGRPVTAALLGLFALLLEEEIAPTLAGLGALLFLIQRGARFRPLRPLAVAPVALIWAALAVVVILPGFRFRQAGQRVEISNRAASHYDQIIQDPSVVLTWLTTERGPLVLRDWLLPAGGLPLLGPEALVAALPGLLVLFLQDRPGTWAGHWSGPLLPIVWIAAIRGLTRLSASRWLLGAGLVMLCGGVLLAYPRDSYFPGGREFEADHYVSGPLEAELGQAIARVPATASLVATRRVIPQLASRADLYQFPFSFTSAPLRPDPQRQDHVILDLSDSPTRRAVAPAESDSILEKRPRYHVLRLGPEVLYLSRGRLAPEEPRADDFGGTVRLGGMDRSEVAAPRPAVTLYWETLRRPSEELVRQIRVESRDGQLALEINGSPLDDLLPIREWDRGQVVAERLRLWELPLPPHRYRVLVGWSLPDGQPLPHDASGAALLEIAEFERP